jgi:hypothetical protein
MHGFLDSRLLCGGCFIACAAVLAFRVARDYRDFHSRQHSDEIATGDITHTHKPQWCEPDPRQLPVIRSQSNW